MSAINEAVEAVMDMIDSLGLFSEIRRGALGTGAELCCEVGPSFPDNLYLDKAVYLPIDLTINGKHSDLETLSNAMNTIHHSLTSAKEYSTGTDWRITDITNGSMPQIVGREDDNSWMMASSLMVKVYIEPYVPPVPPTPEPDEPAEPADTPATGD